MKKLSLALAVTLLAVPMASHAQLKPAELRAFRLTSADPAKLGKFYADTFGFKQIVGPTGGVSVTIVNGGRLAINAPPPNSPKVDIAHLLLNVANVDGTLAKAKANGATIERMPSKSRINNYVAMIRDPGGNMIELVGPVPGSNKIY